MANSDGFWFFQIKDLATFLVGLAGFMTAYVTLRSNVLRKAKVHIGISRNIRLARIYDLDSLECKVDVIMYNSGAQPAVIENLSLLICKRIKYLFFFYKEEVVSRLEWTAFFRTRNIGKEGESLKLFTEFDKPATTIVVPRYDSIEKLVGFDYSGFVDLKPDCLFSIQVEAQLFVPYTRKRKSIRHFFKISSLHLSFLDKETLVIDEVRRRALTIKTYRSRKATISA